MVLECVRLRLSSNKNITISNIIIIIIIITTTTTTTTTTTCCLLKGIVYRLDYITVITENNIIEMTQNDKVVARYYVLRAYHEDGDGAKWQLIPNKF